MSNFLQDVLQDYAIESGLIDDHNANPEEITVITDETVDELDRELESLAAKSEKASREIDTLIESSDAILSVESLILDQLESFESEDFVQNYTRTLQAMTWGVITDSMESHQFPKSVIEEIMTDVSYESSEGEGSKETQATKDKGKLKKAWETVVAWFKRMVAAVKGYMVRFIDLFRTSVDKNRRSSAILISEARSREGSPKNDTIKGKGFSGLAIGNSVDVSKSLNKLEEAYSNGAKGISDSAIKVATSLTDGMSGKSESFLGKFANKFGWKKGTESAIKDGSKLIANHIGNEMPKSSTIELLAGDTIEFVNNEGNLSFRIKSTEGDGPNVGDIKTPSLSEIISIAQAITKVSKTMEKINKDIEANIKATDKIVDSVGKDFIIDSEVDGKSGTQNVAKMVLTECNKILNVAKTVGPLMNNYSLKKAHLAYKFGMTAVKQYPKKGKAAKAEASKAEDTKSE